MNQQLLSIIVIAGNEQNIISRCLNSCKFADEIIVYTNSTDNTQKIIEEHFPDVSIIKSSIPQVSFDFSKARNQAIQYSHCPWILFIDSDEVITDKLRNEIISVINHKSQTHTSYDIPRANYFLGKRVKFGGTYPDYVKRLFKKSEFKGYFGQIHEQPKITGSSSCLKNDLLHYTHVNLTTMLDKSIKWTQIEAKMLISSGHPPIVWWRFIRMMLTKFITRYLNEKMYRDGIIGLISAIFESFDTFMIYAFAYEFQKNHGQKSRHI